MTTTKLLALAATAAVGLSTLAPVAAQAADRRTEHALLGGALGALAGGLIGGDATGALVGAGAGALLGAATTRDHHYGYGYNNRYDGYHGWDRGGYGGGEGYRTYRTSYDYGRGGYGYDRGYTGDRGGYGYDRGYAGDRGGYGYGYDRRGW